MDNLVKLFLDKISTYEILNNLLPGIVFKWFFGMITGIDLVPDEGIESIFICYIMGLIIGRIGSVIIETCLTRKRKSGRAFVTRASHSNYLKAAETDDEIKVLNAKNNVYRTCIALTLSLMAVFIVNELYKLCKIEWRGLFKNSLTIGGLFSLVILFAYSYKKQTKYILGRVEKQLEN